MKNKKNKYIVILITIAVLSVCAFFLFSFLNPFNGSPFPEKAVVNYLEASFYYDADNMVKYASEYQKIKLNGGTDYTDQSLKKKLKKYYGEVESVYKNSQITFAVIKNINIKKDSDEFAEVIEKYEFVAGESKIAAINKVTVKITVDGTEKQTSVVYAVNIGGKWYYGLDK